MNSLNQDKLRNSLSFENLLHMDGSMKHCEDWEGKDIAESFNSFCDAGMEIEYVEDSEWRFVDFDAARRAMDAIDYQDQKRCSD